MKKSEWLDCQGNEFFAKQKGTPSLVKIEHKNTATLDSARSKKNLKSQFCNYSEPLSNILYNVLSDELFKHPATQIGCKSKRPLVKMPHSQNVPELVKTSPNTK